MKDFAERIAEGDIVGLKRPTRDGLQVIAVGQVEAAYEYADVFGDVDGWDLQHTRRISWRVPRAALFPTGLNPRGTLSRVVNQGAKESILRAFEEGEANQKLDMPQSQLDLSVDELVDLLIVEGLPSQRAEIIAKEIWRLRRLAKWYFGYSANVGEHEIRTFLIVPLLLSMGWAEQKMKIEWNSMDIALFADVYKSDDKPSVIIESKRLYSGLKYAESQVHQYSEKYPDCKMLVVTDGIRYKLYKKDKASTWKFSAYLNLLHPSELYPLDPNIQGATSFFRALAPRVEM